MGDTKLLPFERLVVRFYAPAGFCLRRSNELAFDHEALSMAYLMLAAVMVAAQTLALLVLAIGMLMWVVGHG